MNPFSLLKRSPVKKRRTGAPRKGPKRSREYLQFIRSMLCVVCFRSSWIEMLERGEIWRMSREYNCYTRHDHATEAAHTGVRGFGQKASDFEAIPLCAEHHQTGKHSHHRMGKKFFEYHGIDRDALILALNQKYTQSVCKGEIHGR